VAWPFSGLPFNDDWSWALTVKNLHETGHMVYNGWSSPSVIAQAYWGLLWVKVFGFSFNVLRVSSLPLSAGAIAMCYALARRVGLTAALSVFITLTLGLSPWFLPLASTFMTDVPGLFFMLLAMYVLLRGFETPARNPAIAWIILGAAVALVGGSSRQLVWIVPLVVLPYVAWLRRMDRVFVFFAIASVALVFAGAMGVQHWFAQQPYSLPDPPVMSYLRSALHHPAHLVRGIIFLVLTTALILLPIWPELLRHLTSRRLILALIFLAVIGLGLGFFHHWIEPWMGNIVTSSGTLGSIAVAGGRPTVVPISVRMALSFIVLAVVSLLLALAVEWVIGQSGRIFTVAGNFFLKPADQRAGVPAILLTVIALLGLEMTRVVFDVAYDRHLLPFIPFLAIPLLMCFQKNGLTKMPAGAWMILLLFALFGIAATQEVNSLARARVTAVNRVLGAGYGPQEISAGFEHDFWTQGVIAGHVNDIRVLNPPNAYDKRHGLTPAMRVKFRLESGKTDVTKLTDFGTVDYFSLLPPFHRRIYIDEFTDPWWLDEKRAATRPAEKSLLPLLLLEQYRK
jgi:hypothetical protein